jgi:hypothetical protein
MAARANRVGTFVAVLVVILTARDGAAQDSVGGQRVFAGASVAWNIDHSVWSQNGSERSGGTTAVGLAAGFNFADRWSVQVEGEWPTSDQTVVNQYPTGYPYGHPSGYQSYSSVTRTTYRTPTVAVLFGVHVRPSTRVDVAFQFGPGFRNERQSDEYQSLSNGTVTESHQYSWNDWLLRMSVGAEAAVRVTSRVAVVGQLRVHGLLDPWGETGRVVRPAIGVRVKF